MLRQYLYVSTAPGLQRDELDAIIASCERNNAARRITGFLLYNGRNFIQLLEGEEADLLWVMRRISTDPRHSGLSVLEDMPVGARACPDWLMRHIRLVDKVEDRRAALEGQLPSTLSAQLKRIILNFAVLN
ncbi:BLUF domain-containing protein [Pontixanthobacter sp.]|uniref:BLUF domain-containing protein n=1 Tax=Pontixanthobacter sp. TaxID=2792078 RepID=UPI003C7D05EB